jgi:hypothetical protein
VFVSKVERVWWPGAIMSVQTPPFEKEENVSSELEDDAAKILGAAAGTKSQVSAAEFPAAATIKTPNSLDIAARYSIKS